MSYLSTTCQEILLGRLFAVADWVVDLSNLLYHEWKYLNILWRSLVPKQRVLWHSAGHIQLGQNGNLKVSLVALTSGKFVPARSSRLVWRMLHRSGPSGNRGWAWEKHNMADIYALGDPTSRELKGLGNYSEVCIHAFISLKSWTS